MEERRFLRFNFVFYFFEWGVLISKMSGLVFFKRLAVFIFVGFFYYRFFIVIGVFIIVSFFSRCGDSLRLKINGGFF